MRFPRFRLILASQLAAVAITAGAAFTHARPSLTGPNVIVVLADDQGWGDLSCHGNPNLRTPHLDALRAAGASFERFYVQPVCAPTRAELLTGCYAQRVGVSGVTSGRERLDPKFPTIADAFRAAGYATAAFGKWHNGTQAPYHPLCRGFDSFYGFTSGHWADYFSPILDENGTMTRGEGFLPDDITDRTIQFVEQHRNRPFFALVAFNTPHSPMQVPDRWWNAHAEQNLLARGTDAKREVIGHTRAALAMCESLDWNLGRLLGALERNQISDNTVIVYLTDNGPNGHRFNAGMRGIKGSTDEGGVRSPLFIRWPLKIQPKTLIEAPSAVIDLAPTLAELAGVTLREAAALDGVSVAQELLGLAPHSVERTIFTSWRGRTAARRGAMLLNEEGRLYDLGDDPGQLVDLSSKRPEVVKELQQAIERWAAEVARSRRPEEVPFTVGHPSLATTQLPIRDATATGTIRRSSQHPNSSYFTNWTSTDDTIRWNVEVAEAGRFVATVHYTCAAANVGSLVELRYGDQTCRTTVSEAFDPPLAAAKRDRYPRKESDMKRFRRLRIGEIDLPAGRGDLTFRAIATAGLEVMDIRLLELTRLE